jgi:hypothetical protein
MIHLNRTYPRRHNLSLMGTSNNSILEATNFN